MKRRFLVIPEVESQCEPGLRYTVVSPPKYFVRTDILTVFPELREVMDNSDIAAPSADSACTAHCSTSSGEAAATAQRTTPLSPFIITTFQVSHFESLIGISDAAQEFKDHSRERFLDFMHEVQRRLAPEGWWVDFADPATGLPVQTRGTSTVYCESDAIEQLLSMELMSVCGCRMVVHPIFGEQVYPASAVVYGGTSERLKELLAGL